MKKEDAIKFIQEEIIDKALKSRLKENEIFLSEDDLKFSFAQAAKDSGAQNVILEYPILTEDLYEDREPCYIILDNFHKHCRSRKNCKQNKDCENCDKWKNKREYIDVAFEYNNYQFFIELKYKLAPIEEVFRYNSKFKLCKQGAQNNGLYYIHEDIERMENIKLNRNCYSYVFVITNDSGYWTEHKGPQIKNVQLPNGIAPQQKEIKYKEGNTNFRKLYIENQYEINWKPFKEDICKNEFKSLLIDLNNPIKR